MIKKIVAACIAVIFIFSLTGCRAEVNKTETEDETAVSIIGGADGPTSVFIAGKIGGGEDMGYKSIPMDAAAALLAKDGSHILVDVRRPDEYAGGHIPGAINIVNENITEAPAELPDKDQLIYVYCRSGQRSKQAAQKLVNLGYTNVVEIGGILDWKGELEK